jgi:nicotinate-nucleotide pyrophosphorylase (carboxylating)
MATGSIAEAVRLSRKISSVPVEVEVENLAELRLALTAEPDRIMLDNFSLQDMRRAVTLNNGKIELEASGNISLEKVRIIAGTGVDFISVGALTKNLRAIDLSMRIIMT